MECDIKLAFDPDVAKDVGVEEAIMLSNLKFWCTTNEKHNINFYEGKTWMYHTQESFVELFPFWTRRQIQRILKKLTKKGYIIEGNFNKVKYDQTKWYSIVPKNEQKTNLLGEKISSKTTMNEMVRQNEPYGSPERTIWEDRTNDMVQPIQDNKTDNNKKIVLIESSAFSKFWQEYPKKELKKKTLAIWKREKLDKHISSILVFIDRAKKTDRWEKGFIKQPPAFLNGQCWEDDLAAYGPSNKKNSPGVYKSKNGLKIEAPIKV